jgi:hypothetical protein
MSKQQEPSSGAAAQTELDRARREIEDAERAVDRVGDEALADYERRRERLADDLTGELPNDSPEAQ